MKKVLSLLLCCLLTSAVVHAQSKDEKEVTAVVETFRKSLVDPEKAVLEKIVSQELTFGHSGGKVEGKSSMIEKLVSGRTDWVSVNFTDQTVKVYDKTAIVRHRYTGELKSGETTEPINMHVLMVWQKQKGQWQLIARQAVKL